MTKSNRIIIDSADHLLNNICETTSLSQVTMYAVVILVILVLIVVHLIAKMCLIVIKMVYVLDQTIVNVSKVGQVIIVQ